MKTIKFTTEKRLKDWLIGNRHVLLKYYLIPDRYYYAIKYKFSDEILF